MKWGKYTEAFKTKEKKDMSNLLLTYSNLCKARKIKKCQVNLCNIPTFRIK